MTVTLVCLLDNIDFYRCIDSIPATNKVVCLMVMGFGRGVCTYLLHFHYAMWLHEQTHNWQDLPTVTNDYMNKLLDVPA